MKGIKWKSRILLACAVFVAFVIVMFVNFMIAVMFLMRVREFDNSMDGIGKRMSPVASPLVLKTGEQGSEEEILQKFKNSIHFSSGTQIGSQHDHFIELDYVTRLNPYPQPLSIVHDNLKEVNYLSFGYLGTDERYHQITHYWGESDTTPSILIRKVRGPYTGHGDNYVCYTLYLSKDLKPRPLITDSRTGQVVEYEPPSKRPNIDRIDWIALAWGEGFEYFDFAFYATLIEGLLIASALALWRYIGKIKFQQTTNI